MIEAHICYNRRIRHYPQILCSCCAYGVDILIRERDIPNAEFILEHGSHLKSVLSDMNTEVIREPVSPAQVKQEIDDVFVFNPPLSRQHATSCEKVQNACKALAQVIADEVPEGKERTIAVNNLLSTALFARHGITRRQVVLVATALPQDMPSPVPLPGESTVPQVPTSVPATSAAT